MSQRRMFSPTIVCSDAFLDMPSSARDLYYQLGMYADDDGFVNPRKIMRMLGSSEDDLKILMAKRFVLPFPSGVLVIKHWKINNMVRKDWYRPTQYIDEMSHIRVKENGSYTEIDAVKNSLVNESSTNRQHRLGKVRLGTYPATSAGNDISSEVSEDLIPTSDFGKRKPKNTPQERKDIVWVFFLFKEINPAWESWYQIPAQRGAAIRLLKVHGREKIKKAFEYSQDVRDENGAYQVDSPYDLEQKWAKLKIFKQKHG